MVFCMFFWWVGVRFVVLVHWFRVGVRVMVMVVIY